MAEGNARSQMTQRLLERASKDPAFRQSLLRDPSAAVKQELGVDVPANVKLHVVEENRENLYLVLPLQKDGSGKLSDEQLATVAGGYCAPLCS